MSLKYFQANAPLDKVLGAIKKDGAAIVTDAASETNRASFASELAPYLKHTPFGRDHFTGRKTRRTGALIARMPSSHDFVMDERVLRLAKDFLKPFTEKITLHLSQATTIYPDENAQLMHRDRFAWGYPYSPINRASV